MLENGWRVWGLGFRGWGLGNGVEGIWLEGLGFRIYAGGMKVCGLRILRELRFRA